MDPNEKIQLDDITFDDVLSGEGVAMESTEEIAVEPEVTKTEETPVLDDIEQDTDSPTLDEIDPEIPEQEEEEEKEEDTKDDHIDELEEDEEEDSESIINEVLDNLGYEVDGANYDDTSEGLIEMTKDIASQMADERIDTVLNKFPLVKQHLEYVLNGGQSQEFMNANDPNVDYNNLSIADNDSRSQKAILGDYLAMKGHETEFIKEMLEDYEDTGKLRDRSEAARKALAKYQDEEKAQLIEKQKVKQQETAQQQETFWSGISDTIETSREFAGLKVSEKDKNDFYAYLSTPINKEGYTQRDVDHLEADMDVKLAIDYLMFKGFDLDTIINTKAKTQSVRSLKDRISRNESRTKSSKAGQRRSTKFDIDDLDLSI
jgi:hypothetical protein